MKNIILKIITILIFILVISMIFFQVGKLDSINKVKYSNLVVFGDDIATDYTPFVENGGVYISVDTISKVLDEYIYYDKVATKVIITTYDEVVKMKIDDYKISNNLEVTDISTPAKLIDLQPYVDINLLKDVYDIKVSYNEETSTIVIDKKDEEDYIVKYDRVKVYSGISTSSEVLTTLSKGDNIYVYIDSLKHNRWYKIKTESGVVGYVAKNTVDFVVDETSENNEDKGAIRNDKIVMFWQYGSNLETLGGKQEGVNVVSPTWYELKNSNGDITSDFSSKYYSKAKENGYKIWPIITNGIDSVNYSYDDTSNLLNSEKNRENFIKNLLKICQNDNLDGINMDFESMKVDDRDLYSQLIKEMAPILRKHGITLSVDMYFVSYIDRKVVGKFSDYVILMGYDQRGSWSSEAGSISECKWVEKNVESLINDSKIDASKIILGVPFYTRLWTENSSNGNLSTKIYSMKNCTEFLQKYNLQASYDEMSGQNYAEYKSGNLTYRLWIEDDSSMKNRVDIIKKYNLAGISAWRRGLENNSIWNVICENL